jgi:hypothetical protein
MQINIDLFFIWELIFFSAVVDFNLTVEPAMRKSGVFVLAWLKGVKRSEHPLIALTCGELVPKMFRSRETELERLEGMEVQDIP